MEAYRQYFSMSYPEFLSGNNVHSSQVCENVKYEKLTDVTRVSLPEGADFYFRGDKLLLIYVSEGTLATKLWYEFKTITNSVTPEKIVRSRAGKTANQVIFTSYGITASITKDDVHFIEIYSPCTLEYYLENIYEEPQPFIR